MQDIDFLDADDADSFNYRTLHPREAHKLQIR